MRSGVSARTMAAPRTPPRLLGSRRLPACCALVPRNGCLVWPACLPAWLVGWLVDRSMGWGGFGLGQCFGLRPAAGSKKWSATSGHRCLGYERRRVRSQGQARGQRAKLAGQTQLLNPFNTNNTTHRPCKLNRSRCCRRWRTLFDRSRPPPHPRPHTPLQHNFNRQYPQTHKQQQQQQQQQSACTRSSPPSPGSCTLSWWTSWSR